MQLDTTDAARGCIKCEQGEGGREVGGGRVSV